MALGTVLIGDRERNSVHHTGTRFFLMEVATGKERFHCSGWDDMTTDMILATDGRFLAIADTSDHHDRPITVWDAVRGKVVARFQQPNNVTCLEFSTDGSRLASALSDGTILIWDLAKLREPAVRKLGDNELTGLWQKLASGDAREAFVAIHAMAAARKQAPAFLRARLTVPDRATAKQIERWIADLDDTDFAKRDGAYQRLAGLGMQADGALRKAVAHPASLEQQRRIRLLLDRRNRWPRTPDQVQQFRAIEVLELIGSPEALRVLEEQAAHASERWRAEEARQAATRLRRESGPAGNP